MKKIMQFLLLLIILSRVASAQTPLAIPYQAVARTASGNLISNQLISVRFAIHDGSASGTVVYKEKHTPTTNAFGLFNVNIGTGTIISGTMASINWGINTKFLQVELDTTGGNSFIDMGTTQLMSVPYALHAKTVDKDKGGKTYLILTGDITDAQADSILQSNVGPNTQFVKIFNTANLTTVDLSGCIELVKLEVFNNAALSNITLTNVSTIHETLNINNNQLLTSVALPALTVASGELIINDNPNLASITLSGLTRLFDDLTIYNNTNVTSINLGNLQSINQDVILNIDNGGNNNPIPLSLNLNNLTTINGTFDLFRAHMATLDLHNLTAINGNVHINDVFYLTSINLNNLTSITGSFKLYHLEGLTSINLNNLTLATGFFEVKNITTLISINFNNLNTIGGSYFEISGNSALTTINMPAVSSIANSHSIIFASNSLSSSVINNLLAKFVSVPVFSGTTIHFAAQFPVASPTGQGIIDKNTLISNGNNVITD